MEEFQQEEVEVKFKFWLPEHKDRLDAVMNVDKLEDSLREICDSCRYILKYKENPSDGLSEFAEEIYLLAQEHLGW